MKIFEKINKACKDEKLSHSEFRVFMVLISYNGGKSIFPSISRISQDCGIKSHADISRKLNKLQKLGYIKITRRRHQSNLYRITDFANSSKAHTETAKPAKEKKPAVQPEEVKAVQPATTYKQLSQEQKEQSILYSTVAIYSRLLYNRHFESADFSFLKKLLKIKDVDNFTYHVKCLMLLKVIQSVKAKATEKNFKGILFNAYRDCTSTDLQKIFKKPAVVQEINSITIPYLKRKIINHG